VTAAPDASDTASMAKAFSTETAVRVAGKAMQLHGGMGYTWESGIHAYARRASETTGPVVRLGIARRGLPPGSRSQAPRLPGQCSGVSVKRWRYSGSPSFSTRSSSVSR
jgi:hypothetical protein